MEDGLRAIRSGSADFGAAVLILVVVEDGLRVEIITLERDGDDVLILVVVEDGLRDAVVMLDTGYVCLNPCCCGRWSQRNYKCNENILTY